VLCVDKTGTLTRNRMQVAALWRDGESWSPGGGAPAPASVQRLLDAAVAASAPRPLDPMDRALRGLSGRRSSDLPLASFPLKPERLAFIQAWADAPGVVFAAKGAPEAIFAMCRLAPGEVAAVQPVVEAFAARGWRVLAVASARADSEAARPEDLPFELEGLAAFEDPVREEAPAAVAAAREAGVKVVMITGDYPATALEIARQAGVDAAGGVLTGEQVRSLDEPALRRALLKVRVFARIAPDQKLRLVAALKANGEVVAMFGDGVNDAPALEAAHVGVAMGERGADVAREAADLILLDDRFASIVDGVAEGRRIFANVRATVAYLVIVHVPMAGLALLPPLLDVAPVMYPLQVVLLELVIDPMCALVFEGRPAETGAMKRPPRAPDEPLFSRTRVGLAALSGLVVLGVVMGQHLALLRGGVDEDAARAATLVALVAGNFAAAAALCRAGVGEPSAASRRTFWAMAAGASAILALALFNPWTARLFQVAAPPAWLTFAAAGVGVAAGYAAGAALAAVSRRLAESSAAPLRTPT
jgi:Ca2+-transporting ATPase